MRGQAVRAVLAIATVPTAAAIASRASDDPVFAAIDDIGKPEFSPELDSPITGGGTLAV